MAEKVPNHKDIGVLKITRQSKLIINTVSSKVVAHSLTMQNLMNIAVNATCQVESITTKFLLHNIDPQVDCKEIAEELGVGPGSSEIPQIKIYSDINGPRDQAKDNAAI